MRAARRRADAFGVDYAHFTGQRRWTDSQLSRAVANAGSWQDVVTELGLSVSGYSTVRSHAVRLGLNTTHLLKAQPAPDESSLVATAYDSRHLRSAGSLFAACWFTLRGMQISWPLEPCRYDLIVEVGGTCQRIQVKTTMGVGTAADVVVSNSRRQGSVVYAPNEIDSYFIIDGKLNAYLIPYEVVAGYRGLRLRHYVNFKIIERGALLSEPASP